MRLSQAMRKGAAMTPPSRLKFHNPDTGGTCALGAASIGSSGILSEKRLVSDFPVLMEPFACPHCAVGTPGLLYLLIVHLNDYHRVPREEIADWIERNFEVPKEIQEKNAGDPPPVPASVVHKIVGLCPAPANDYVLPAHDEVLFVPLEGK